MIQIYGIKNCGTMKKAMSWLTEHNIEFTFHDYKKEPMNELLLNRWLKELDWQLLVNRKGTTWRKLPEEIRESINKKTAIQLMLENNSLIKRPVLNTGKQLVVGFSEENYEAIFK